MDQATPVPTPAAPLIASPAPATTTTEAAPEFPKKRRGRPPGRPNTTVNEEDYQENPLVQAWNATKSERPTSVLSVNVRVALTPASLMHDTQRAIYALRSREVIYFVQGWITARHIASRRPSYVNGLLIHSRGQDASTACTQCADKRAKNALGPFLVCRVLPGKYHNSCSNCKWFDNTSVCSLYTGPRPNRKRKAKELANGEADATAAEEDGADAGDVGEVDPDVSTLGPIMTPVVQHTEASQHLLADNIQPDLDHAVAPVAPMAPMTAEHYGQGVEETVEERLESQLLSEMQHGHPSGQA